MTNAEILERAKSQVGKLRYKLGRGGNDPKADRAAPLAWAVPKGSLIPALARWADCSGFVAWCLGIRRSLPIPNYYVHTDAIYFDAINVHRQRLFVALGAAGGNRLPFDPQPGDLVVFPDYKDATGKHREGHVAIIVDHSTRMVIDCASGRQDGVAIHRAGEWWNKAIVVRFKGL